MTEPPPFKTINKMRWTAERARRMPWVSWRGVVPHVGDRELVYHEDQEAAISRVYVTLPPTVGILRLYSIIEQRYIGVRRTAVKAFLQKQPGSQIYRRRNRVSTTDLPPIKMPLYRWQADYGSFGSQGHYTWDGRKYTSFLVIVDSFTKYTFIGPVKAETTAETQRVLMEWYEHLQEIAPDRPPRILQTDNGAAFSDELATWMREHFSMKLVHGRPYNAVSQGQAERMVQTVKGYLRSSAEQKFPTSKKKLPWPKCVEEAMLAINSGYTRAIRMSPREAITASTTTIRERLEEQRRTRAVYTAYFKDPLKAGDKVRLSLRVVGDSSVKAAIKAGTWKSSNRQWSDDVYTVEVPYGKKAYYLSEIGGRFDRADLLRVPADTPGVKKRPAPEDDTQVGAKKTKGAKMPHTGED